MQYLFDTNAVIYFLEGREKNFIDETDVIFISCITKIELLSGDISNKDMAKVYNFVENSKIISLDEEIIEKTIEIRRKFNLKIPDAIIVRTSIQKK